MGQAHSIAAIRPARPAASRSSVRYALIAAPCLQLGAIVDLVEGTRGPRPFA